MSSSEFGPNDGYSDVERTLEQAPLLKEFLNADRSDDPHLEEQLITILDRIEYMENDPYGAAILGEIETDDTITATLLICIGFELGNPIPIKNLTPCIREKLTSFVGFPVERNLQEETMYTKKYLAVGASLRYAEERTNFNLLTNGIEVLDGFK